MAEEKSILHRLMTETWPAKLAGSVLEALMLPGDVAQGRAALPSYAGIPGSVSYGSEEGQKNFGRMTDLAGTVMGGSYAAAPPVAGGAGMGIRAYHGSPHDFERFDMSKIGTGEGAQAFGHGLYFAENPATAQAYRDRLSDLKPRAIEGNPDLTVPSWVAKTIESRNPAAINQIKTDFQGRLADMRRQLADPNTMQPWNIEANIPGIESILRAVSEFEKGAKIAPAGRMYEVNINAKPEQFLDWDRPLSQQPMHLDALRQIGWLSDNVPKANLESIFPQVKGAEASKQLNQAGIPGIKYLDQGSRGSGTGTSNYVLFRDDIIDILRKYGIAGASPLAALMMGGQEKSQ